LSFYDKDKNIFVLERISFVYKHKFHWVSPADVESVLLKHPDVLQAGIVNVPDPVVENVNKAFVVRRLGSKSTEEDLVKFVADQTSFYKHLHRGVTFVDTLPTNLAGKMDRGALKKMALAEA
jgi:4-coumarate--CoA ligase